MGVQADLFTSPTNTEICKMLGVHRNIVTLLPTNKL